MSDDLEQQKYNAQVLALLSQISEHTRKIWEQLKENAESQLPIKKVNRVSKKSVQPVSKQAAKSANKSVTKQVVKKVAKK